MKSSLKVTYHHDIILTNFCKVMVSIRQSNKILYYQTIDMRANHSPLLINFELINLTPIDLCFVTSNDNIKNSPLYIDRIEFDDIVDIPRIAHSGKFNGQFESGNCLYDSGELIYTFKLPLCSER